MSPKPKLKHLFFALVLCWFVFACKPALHVTKIEKQHYPVQENTIDSSTYFTILPYKKQMEAQMNEEIGFALEALTKDQPEGNLGNFVTDCLMKQGKKYLGKDSANLNAVILNNGGLRTSVPQGSVTVGRIFELMPFDNELTIVELTGKQTQDMIRFIAEKGGIPVSGIKMQISKGKALNASINGQAIDTLKNYYVMSSDYLTNGGDKMEFFKNPVKAIPLKVLIRDAIIDYCKSEYKKGNKIKAGKDGRISITE